MMLKSTYNYTEKMTILLEVMILS